MGTRGSSSASAERKSTSVCGKFALNKECTTATLFQLIVVLVVVLQL